MTYEQKKVPQVENGVIKSRTNLMQAFHMRYPSGSIFTHCELKYKTIIFVAKCALDL